MLYEKGNIQVRELEEHDKTILTSWLVNPCVLEYYEGRDNPFDLQKVTEVFFQNKDQTSMCMVQLNHRDIGYIQFYPLDEEDYKQYGYSNEKVFGMDQFIGEVDYWNKGIGTLLVTSMVEFLIQEKDADCIIMDPHIQNVRALRCYEKCGFKKVKMLPKHELHEGNYRDCWLIEYRRTDSERYSK